MADNRAAFPGRCAVELLAMQLQMAGNNTKMLQVVDYLVAREAAERTSDENAG